MRKKDASIKSLLQGMMGDISGAAETTSSALPGDGSPVCQLSHVSPRDTSHHISSTGSFSTQEEPWPVNVWMPTDECDNASRRGFCDVKSAGARGIACHPASSTVKLLHLSKVSPVPQRNLEAPPDHRL